MRGPLADAAALGLVLAVGAIGSAAAATPAGDKLQCRNGIFPDENPRLSAGRITPGPPVRLLGDMHGCPDAGPRCATADVLQSGASVIVGRAHGDLVCLLRPDGSGGLAGWAARDRVAAHPPAEAPSPAAWRGWWRDGSDVLLLDPKPGRALMVSGRAVWQGLASPHFGQINATGRPQGNLLQADDPVDGTGCRATLQLVEPYLVVADNGACGGMNVSFTGVYRRFTPKAPHRRLR